MRKNYDKWAFVLMAVVIVLLLVYRGFAQDIPPVIPNTFLQDHADVLSPEDEGQIEQALADFKTKYNLEYGVATVRTTGRYSVDEYGLAMARQYGIGSKDNEKRGLLLLLAVEDRKWRFEISRHMEGVLTDGQSGSIGRNSLVPKLKVASKTGNSADWRDAILATLAATDTTVAKNIEPERIESQTPTDYTGLWILWGSGLFVGAGGAGAYALRRRRVCIREERERAERLAREEKRRAEAERLAAIEAERKRKEHEAWLKTPEGIAYTKEQERLEAERQERLRLAAIEEERRAEEHRRWLKTPEGIAYTKEQKRLEAARLKREEEERAARRERERREEEERAERRRRESSYSSSSSSDWGSSSSSSSSGGFGGGGDFGGGGSSGSW